MILASLRSSPLRLWRRPALAGLAVLLSLAAAPPAPAAGERPFGDGLLWRVERAGQAPSHVFGTMHTADRQVVALPQAVKDTLDGAGSLVLEIIMSEQVRGELVQAMVLPEGKVLGAIVGPERFERVLSAAARYGIPREQLRILKPWALTMFFSLPPSEFQRQAAGGVPLDQVLQDSAQDRGTALHGIETPAEQMAIVAELPEPTQLALLDAAIEANPRIEPIFEAMKTAYLDRDLSALHRLADEMSEGTDQDLQKLFLERMVDSRNERMVKRIAPHLAEGNAFVAVGALHLSGERGVLSLLEKQGYRVSRVY
ncbi:MAG: TraB/GumN family protein [Rhodospirillales bacterium]|nr:TraB/GumN family protein [Rhodospirillales bacterium]MDH3913159.1 TraB/GumN family protein [Rhodospirillales bacterium]MDH3918003.1 TraB/GumN family protein [Rhodospirillales bacterium]MDH3966935.1 TraB/GumN family protein [Rhodospirillales bacterium]